MILVVKPNRIIACNRGCSKSVRQIQKTVCSIHLVSNRYHWQLSSCSLAPCRSFSCYIRRGGRYQTQDGDGLTYVKTTCGRVTLSGNTSCLGWVLKLILTWKMYKFAVALILASAIFYMRCWVCVSTMRSEGWLITHISLLEVLSW